MKPHKHRPETEAVRGANDLSKKNGPLSTPIYQTSTFEVTDNEQQLRATGSDQFYTRYGNPTITAAEAAMAELEGSGRRIAIRLRHGGDHDLHFCFAKKRRPHRGPARCLRRSVEISRRMAAQVRR